MKRFKDYGPDQLLLLPSDINDWLEEDHLAYFMRDVVGELDLSQIYDDYHSRRGEQPALPAADDGQAARSALELTLMEVL